MAFDISVESKNYITQKEKYLFLKIITIIMKSK